MQNLGKARRAGSSGTTSVGPSGLFAHLNPNHALTGVAIKCRRFAPAINEITRNNTKHFN